MTMRAARVHAFGGPDAIAVERIPRPRPGPGEVLVEVAAVPVNFVDLYVIGGSYQFLPALPFTPGKGPAGTIAEVGDGVDGWHVGDRVLAMAEIGGYAEFALAEAGRCYRMPDALGFVSAASLSLAYETAWFALTARGRLRAGETLLVLGASGAVGLACVQLGKLFGARVLAGISRPDRAAAVREAGADAIVDLSAPALKDSLREEVRSITGGTMADLVVDPLGGDAFDAALRALAWCGRLVVVGFAAGRIPSVRANYLLVKNIEVSGLQVSDYRNRRPELTSACFEALFAHCVAGRLRLPEALCLPLERASDGLTAIRDRTTDGRRVVLTP